MKTGKDSRLASPADRGEAVVTRNLRQSQTTPFDHSTKSQHASREHSNEFRGSAAESEVEGSKRESELAMAAGTAVLRQLLAVAAVVDDARLLLAEWRAQPGLGHVLELAAVLGAGFGALERRLIHLVAGAIDERG